MARARIWITDEANRMLVRGRLAGRLLSEGGFRPIFVGTVRAYILDRHRLADVCAYLDYRNVPFEVTTHRPSDAA